MTSNFVVYPIIFFIFASIIYLIKQIQIFLWNCFIVNKNKRFIEMWDIYMGRSYDYIFTTQIFSMVSQGYRPSEKELETIKRNYIKLCIGLMGDNIYNIMKKYYGNEQSMMDNMLFYFDGRYDHDLIQLPTIMKDSKQDSK